MTLAERLNRHIVERKLTVTEVAEKIGYGRSALSQYLHGKYQSDTTNLEEKVEEYLKQEGESAVAVKIRNKFFSSIDSMNIIALCKACQEDMALGVIVGQSGFGKTMTLKKYANLDKVIYIECDVGMCSSDLLADIEHGLGLPEGKGTGHRRKNNIIDFFNVNKGYLLIIDEADKLISKDTIRKLEDIRNIFDKADVGIVLAGEPKLEFDIKSFNDRLANRIDMFIKLKGLQREEVIKYLENYSITESAMEELIYRANNAQNGCFRLLDRTMKNVLRLVGFDGKITMKVIEQASSMMLL